VRCSGTLHAVREPSPSPAAVASPSAGRGHVALFFVFATGYFLAYFLRSANAVLAPSLQLEVGLSPADLGFMTGALFGAYAAAQFPVGLALDRWGPRWVAASLMLVGALGCILFAVGTTFLSLTVARVLLGVGTGSVLLAGLKAFSLWFPPTRYATVSGIYFATGSLGAFAAATPLALLEGAIGWRAAFLVAAALVTAAALLIALRSPSVGRRTADAPAPTASEPKAGATGDVLRLMLMTFFFTGPTLAFQTLWAGPLLFEVHGFDSVAAGNLLLLMSIGVTAGYAASGALADRFGLFEMTSAGAIAFVVMQLVLATHYAPILPAAFVLFGFTGGHCVLILANGRRLLGAARSGRATGAVNAAGIGGVFIAQWAIGIVVGAVAEPADAYRWALGATAALTLVAWLVYLPVGRRVRALARG
jgi:MFS family permease